METTDELYQVAEVDLVWKSKIPALDRPKIISSSDAFQILKRFYSDDWIEHHEEFKILILNRSNRVLGKKDISVGGMTGTVTDIRIIMQSALMFCKSAVKYTLKGNGTSLILCHNHPSGNLDASEADISLTRKLKEAAALCDIGLLDHLIITSGEKYFSFADDGRL